MAGVASTESRRGTGAGSASGVGGSILPVVDRAIPPPLPSVGYDGRPGTEFGGIRPWEPSVTPGVTGTGKFLPVGLRWGGMREVIAPSPLQRGVDVLAPSPLQQWTDVLDPSMALDPLLLGLAVVSFLVLSGGTAQVVRHRRRTRGGDLRRLLASRDEVAVLVHPKPDPDAMACAVGVKHIAEDAGTPATIQYPGQIRHQENRAFRTVLELDLDRIRAARDLAADDVVLVDHNRPRGFEGAGGVDPLAVVDHHPGDGEGTGFTDVRPDYGACASIVAEYLADLGAELGEPDADGPIGADEPIDADGPAADGGLVVTSALATGLVYGILSDTKNLTRGSSGADFAAIEFLYPGVDEDLLDRIANPEVDAEVLDVQSRAIRAREERSPYAVSDVGPVDNLDTIPQAADELINLEGISALVVVGEKDGSLHFSGRSRDDRVHIGRALESAVDDIPMAGAGGHARMGGGQVSIDHMEGLGPSKGLSRAEFHDALFDAMAGDE